MAATRLTMEMRQAILKEVEKRSFPIERAKIAKHQTEIALAYYRRFVSEAQEKLPVAVPA